MQIGNLVFSNPFFLAPMAGYTDLPFRLLCRKFGAALTYTEMVSAAGLSREHKKTLALLKSTPEDKPLAVQLFGNDAAILAKAAKIAADYGADMIDLNCGCAVKKVVKQGAGSALLQNPELLVQMIAAMVDSVSIPVTIKLRSGWDKHSEDLIELAEQLQSSGVKAISLHPRTAQQSFQGNAEWSLIKQLKQHLVIPVIGSGDIKTALDSIKMLNQTGCDAVMFARGALGQPWIFAEAIALYYPNIKRSVPLPKDIEEKTQIMLNHLQAIVNHYGEPHGVRIFRSFACHYVKGWENAAHLRNRINQLNTVKEIESLLAS
jgi:tRNA-dihydrouridine synthase B